MKQSRTVLYATVGLLAVLAIPVGWRVLRSHDPLKQADRLMAAGNPRGAQLVLRNTVLHDPRNVPAHFRLAEVELAMGDPVGAEREGRDAASRGYDPAAITVLLTSAVLQQQRFAEVLNDDHPTPAMNNAQAVSILIDRATAQYALGQHDDAAASIAEARRRDPKSFEAAMASVRFALAAHDYPAAQREVATALSIRPNAPAALLMRAEILEAAGDANGALAGYDAVIASSDDPGARLARADILTVMGKPDAARADLDVVLKRSPTNPMANFLLARLLISARNWPDADAALKNATPVLSRYPRSELYVAVVDANMQRPQQALDAAERFLARTQGTDLDGARLVAQLSLRMDQPARAVAVLEPVVQAGHADAPLLQLLAIGYQQNGQPDQAVQTLERARQLAPADVSILNQLAAIRLANGNAGQAATDLQTAFDQSQTPVALPAGGIMPASLSSTTTTAQNQNPAQIAASLIEASLRAGKPDQAAAALKRLRAMHGIDPFELDLLGGQVSLATFDLSGARTQFAAAAKLRPADLTPQVELARVMALQGEVPAAERMLGAMADKDPANRDVLSSLTALLLSQGNIPETTRRMQAAHDATPGDQELTTALAQVYVRGGDLKHALALLTSVDGTPIAPLLEFRARVQMQLQQPKDAVDSLRLLAVQLPGNPAVTQQLAEALLATGDVDAARAVLRDGLATNPGNVTLMTSAVSIAARAGTDAGLAMADQLTANKANLPAALPLKGDLLMAQHRAPEALESYQAANKIAPSGVLQTRIAIAEEAANKPDAAMATLRDWMAKNPNDAYVAKVLAGLDIAHKHLPQARDELEIVVRQYPDDGVALNNLAWLQQQAGDLDQARKTAQHAYLMQSTPQTADTLGWIIFQQGDAPNALPLLQQAAASMHDDPSVQYHYAAALQKTGRTADATAILKPVLARPGSFDDKQNATQLLAAMSHP